MRKIKFRAFWKDTGKPIQDFDKEYVIDACNDNIFIVNQLTGLKDKKRKDIYEGDIVRLDGKVQINAYRFTKENPLGIIEYVEDGFIIKVGKDTFENLARYTLNKNCEVIGNIFENPEILKEEKHDTRI